jgi:IS5 family transposase
MFKVLVLQTLYTLSDDQTEYQIRDRLSFMRFVGLALEDRVPDAKIRRKHRPARTSRSAASNRSTTSTAGGVPDGTSGGREHGSDLPPVAGSRHTTMLVLPPWSKSGSKTAFQAAYRRPDGTLENPRFPTNSSDEMLL